MPALSRYVKSKEGYKDQGEKELHNNE
jgi:hypothetical protein